MALRSLGSTLVAKAGTGSASRRKDEERIGGAIPEQAAGGQPESQVRQDVKTPIEAAVPAGSQKVVSTQPLMQPKLDMMGQGSMGNQGLLGEMGGAARAAETGRPIGSITSARTPTTQAGIAPVSGGSNIATKLSNAFGGNLTPEQKTSYAKNVTAPTGGAVNIKNAAPTRYNPTGFLEGTFGGSVKADEPQTFDFERNLAQGIASTLGGIIDQGGKFLGNILPEGNFSENMQSFGNNPQASKDYGIMSNIKQAAGNVAGAMTPKPAPAFVPPKQKASGGGGGGGGGGSWGSTPAKPAQQNVVQQVSNWLRSLFK